MKILFEKILFLKIITFFFESFFYFLKKMENKTFSIIILTIGIPSSGKTTWVKQYMSEHPNTYLISTDQLREELTGTTACDPHQNEMIHNEARERARAILSNPANYKNHGLGFGPEILIDSTNTDIGEWIKYRNLHPCLLIAKLFDVSVEEAMKKQENRERKVPKEVIEQKWQELQENKPKIPYFFNMVL